MLVHEVKEKIFSKLPVLLATHFPSFSVPRATWAGGKESAGTDWLKQAHIQYTIVVSSHFNCAHKFPLSFRLTYVRVRRSSLLPLPVYLFLLAHLQEPTTLRSPFELESKIYNASILHSDNVRPGGCQIRFSCLPIFGSWAIHRPSGSQL